MSVRSVMLGLLIAAAIGGACYFFDHVIATGYMVPHQVPTVVYGGLIVLLMVVNPLLGLLRPNWRLTGRELGVMVALSLVACSIPSWGLCQALMPQTMLPHWQAREEFVVRHSEILRDVPRQMLTDVAGRGDRAVDDYLTGMGDPGHDIGLFQAPWGVWTRTLGFWLPLALSLIVASLGLSLVLHYQWSGREHLTYPISQFAHSLLPSGGQAAGPVLKKRSFWIATGLVAAVVSVNFLNHHWPTVFPIGVPTTLDLTPLTRVFQTLASGGQYILFQPSILFMVIGLMYLLPSSVSFSLAVSPFLFCTLSGILLGYGISLDEGEHLTGTMRSFAYAGGYFGILLLILYAGRHYYGTVLCRSLCLPGGGHAEAGPVWGMRTFLAGGALFVAQLCLVDLPWPLALAYTGLAVMILTVVSRVVAETGVFHIGTEWLPGPVIGGFVGASALGAKAVAIMGLVSGALLIAPGWAAMPFSVQGLKLSELSGAKASRTAAWFVPAVLLALVIAVPATIYWQYDKGLFRSSPDWPVLASGFALRHAAMVRQETRQRDEFNAAGAGPSEDRLGLDVGRVTAFGVAAALAVGLGVCNLRFPRWPLHPVIFVFLGGFQAQYMWLSCLIGWFLKTSALHFGGGSYYARFKPAMIGLVAGEILGQLVTMVVGAVYYFCTGVSAGGMGH